MIFNIISIVLTFVLAISGYKLDWLGLDAKRRRAANIIGTFFLLTIALANVLAALDSNKTQDALLEGQKNAAEAQKYAQQELLDEIAHNKRMLAATLKRIDSLSGAKTDKLAANTGKPVAIIAASITIGKGPHTVSFDGSHSTNAIFYVWAFGDGATATGPTASHTYTELGSYMATLTVANSMGEIVYTQVDSPIIVTR